MSTYAAEATARRSYATIATFVALAILLVIAVVAVVKAFSLASDVNHLSKSVRTLSTSLVVQQRRASALKARLDAQNGMSTTDLQSLQASSKKIEARLKLFSNCMPEIMGQINSLQADVQGTGPLYISPSQTVSRYCQPVLYGSGSTSGG